MNHVIIINGPNLNLTGNREPEIYGTQTLDEYFVGLQSRFNFLTITTTQSNIEGEIINSIQAAGADERCLGIVLNAGAYSHTSIAIADAVKAISKPLVLVHISNIYAREPERRTDLLVGSAKGMICGLGLDGYELALRSLLS
ncbi:MAG: 3-dehydroquinate dehydratase [Flavobacteriaceae bacterium]|nr:3-dehydroquinate dehydratase [Flavobacteriaceae bacterium]